MNIKEKIVISPEVLSGIAKSCSTVIEAMNMAGIEYNWNNFKIFNDMLVKNNLSEVIDKNYIKNARSRQKGKKDIGGYIGTLPNKVFVEKSRIKKRCYLLKKILRLGILENECKICGNDGMWHGEELKMIPDTINGKPRDYRIENLRLLCPNCFSQIKRRR